MRQRNVSYFALLDRRQKSNKELWAVADDFSKHRQCRFEMKNAGLSIAPSPAVLDDALIGLHYGRHKLKRPKNDDGS